MSCSRCSRLTFWATIDTWNTYMKASSRSQSTLLQSSDLFGSSWPGMCLSIWFSSRKLARSSTQSSWSGTLEWCMQTERQDRFFIAKFSRCNCQSSLARLTTCSVTRQELWPKMTWMSKPYALAQSCVEEKREKNWIKTWNQNACMKKRFSTCTDVFACATIFEFCSTLRKVQSAMMVRVKMNSSL